MTKNIETLLENIRKGVIDEKESIQNYLDKLLNSLIQMKYSEQDIGKKISEAVFSTKKENSRLGTCPICKTGVLSIIRSRKSGKRFVGCSEYKGGCRASAPLPQKGSIRIQNRTCISCGWPTLYVVNGKKRLRLCINTSCESKKRIGN